MKLFQLAKAAGRLQQGKLNADNYRCTINSTLAKFAQGINTN